MLMLNICDYIIKKVSTFLHFIRGTNIDFESPEDIIVETFI